MFKKIKYPIEVSVINVIYTCNQKPLFAIGVFG